MTDDTDDIPRIRRNHKYKRHGASAHQHRQAASPMEPRRERLVLTSQHVAHDMELFFLLNADYFKQKC